MVKGQRMASRSVDWELYRISMFAAHAGYVLERHLNPWVAQVLPQWPAPAVQPDRPLALLVDDRPEPLLRFCVLNTLLMGRLQLRVRVYTAAAALQAMQQLLAGLEPWVEVVGLQLDGVDRFSWHTYNALFKSAEFWRLQPAQALLIVQVDTLLIEPLDFGLFGYDYLGSPWSKGKLQSRCFPAYRPDLRAALEPLWESRALCQSVPDGQSNGNGGLSIRNRDRMALICAAESSAPEEPEDIFFARCLERHGAVLPPWEVAQRFSCETHYQKSLGAHASWRYLEAAEQAEIYERHLAHLLGLVAASRQALVERPAG